MEAAWAVQIIPLGLVIALLVEDLDAVILAVGDIHVTLAVGTDAVWQVELPRIDARVAPREQMLPVGRVFMNSGVAIAIRDIELAALWIDRYLGRPVERLPAHPRRRLAAHAERHEQLAIQSELADPMPVIVYTVEHSAQLLVFGQGQAMRAPEEPFAPGPNEAAVLLEDHQRMLGAAENIDAIVGVHLSVDCLADIPALGQPRPVAYFLVDIIARAGLCHLWSLRHYSVVSCAATDN